MDTRVTTALGIEHPIVQAPMAGGPTTAALVAAVSNAGGLGSLGAAYLSPDKLREQVKEIRTRTDRPFNVNLFVPLAFEADALRVERANEFLGPYREELGIEAPGVPLSFEEDFDDQLEVVFEERVPVFSFTFGSVAPWLVGRLRENGTSVVGTATTVREGLRLQGDGVDVVVAQGSEAGGHRATFLGDFEDAMIGTMALVPQMVDALTVPVVASGGIMDGRGLAGSLVLGAGAAQMGTAFLSCEESGADPWFKRAVLQAVEEDTRITRAFSGRAARGIMNRFLLEGGAGEEGIAPYPVQNALTRDVRAAAREQGRPEFMSLWAGQAARLARRTTAATLVRETIEEAEALLAGAGT
ncbi:MAG: NAD(P)H-dependent flavin oxidoreductase [Rubrobacter sp.]